MNKDPFKEYIRHKDPGKAEKGYAWQTAIGLQAVDGIKTSGYLKQMAVLNIEGEINFDEVNGLLDNYYNEKNELHNREMHISGILGEKQDIERKKQDIDGKKQDIEAGLSSLRQKQLEKITAAFGMTTVFGRSDIVAVLGITPSPASALIKKLLEEDKIKKVIGYGKGKYVIK